jgi:hypothetical protein
LPLVAVPNPAFDRAHFLVESGSADVLKGPDAIDNFEIATYGN